MGGSSLLQQQQNGPRVADLAKTVKSDGAGAAIRAASDGKAMASPAKQFDRRSPQNGPATRQNSLPNNNNTSIDDLEATTVTMQKLGKLNFPPINPENQPQEIQDDHTDNIADSIQNEQEITPDCVKLKAAPPAAELVTQAKSTTQEIVVHEVEDIPIESANHKFRVICPTCGDVVPKFHYASQGKRKLPFISKTPGSCHDHKKQAMQRFHTISENGDRQNCSDISHRLKKT